MPLYTYRCEDGHEVEELRSVDARMDVGLCPTCQKDLHLIPPSRVSGKVINGTPKFYPGRASK